MFPSSLAARSARGFCALIFAVSGAARADATWAPSKGATVITGDGAVRGVQVPGGYAFRGLPYAAAPTGDRRWRAPQPPASWRGIRDATQYAPSCPQKPNLFQPPGPQSEDCLYLNVSTPTLRRDASGRSSCGSTAAGSRGRRPQLRRRQARGARHRRRHDQLPARRVRLPRAPGARLAAGRAVRQLRADGPAGGAALGQAQHRALRRRPAQRDDRRSVGRWRVGASPPGLARLAGPLRPGDRGERCVRAQSGVARPGRELGKTFAGSWVAGADRRCLRHAPAGTLVDAFPDAAIPGVVDGGSSRSRSARRWRPGDSPACRSSTA